MYPHKYSVKQSKKILKKKNIKGCSRYDRTQLNRKLLNVSNEEYQKRKNEKMKKWKIWDNRRCSSCINKRWKYYKPYHVVSERYKLQCVYMM